ncbi:UxaA family hydrolase [Desulfoscipio geothermicus]|uniref:Altronate dehydratase large subunit n=1 Tax=Desulfoscipio geothermicus DSM 3669 TaxID=1121426 RepID=A0A1I6DEQ4_9FIRM|nr:UxaA family hydrolase [Desulfoscipio geothermicus]SFR03858.1 altronate dehydratase large subunit [Desulfoscipio geothermicus DSM 3669]
MTFSGFPRPDGAVGVRNYLAVIPTVVCANHVSKSIAREIPGSVALAHEHGCNQIGADADLFKRTLAGLGKNPNVGAVLLVGLGCEEFNPWEIAELIIPSGKEVCCLSIQEEGGTSKAIARGIKLAQELYSGIRDIQRRECPLHMLTVGIECGGSDYTSGIVSNPAAGLCADSLVRQGARVVFSETTEIVGAEHLLMSRIASETKRALLQQMVNRVEEDARRMNCDIRGAQPTPGNIAGGLSTIEEKSLGAICKSGSSPIVDVLEYAEPCTLPGVSFMDTPGHDVTSMVGMVAGGAQLLLFTTGRGTPTGNALAPVIKLCANPETVKKMAENIDIDLSQVVYGNSTLDFAANEIYDYLLKVAAGEKTRAEMLGHCEFGIHRVGPTL